MVRLETITNRKQFWNIHQKYLYEMTQFYDDVMDEEGNYHYGHFESYFQNDPDRRALYILDGDMIVGFALINRYSHLGRAIDYAMAEFTVFPMYRKQGFAFAAAKQILTLYPGKWEIKYNRRNDKAVRLWTKVAAPFLPEVTDLNEAEQIVSFFAAANA